MNTESNARKIAPGSTPFVHTHALSGATKSVGTAVSVSPPTSHFPVVTALGVCFAMYVKNSLVPFLPYRTDYTTQGNAQLVDC